MSINTIPVNVNETALEVTGVAASSKEARKLREDEIEVVGTTKGYKRVMRPNIERAGGHYKENGRDIE